MPAPTLNLTTESRETINYLFQIMPEGSLITTYADLPYRAKWNEGGDSVEFTERDIIFSSYPYAQEVLSRLYKADLRGTVFFKELSNELRRK